MKFNKLFMGFLGALALSSCSSDPAEPDKPVIEEGDSRYMSVSIRNSNPGTRAGGDQTVVDGSGDVYEEGYALENDVKSLRFYFFKEDGSAAPVKYTGENFYDCGEDDIVLSDPSSNMPNEEKILNALVVTNVNSANASVSDIKKMVAVVNYKAIESKLGKSSLTLDQLSALLAAPEESCNESTGFLMTNSTFVNGEAVECAKAISQDDLRTSIKAARENPIDVYVERLVAKVRVRTVWNEEMTLPIVKATLPDDNTEYEAIGLLSKTDGVTEPITVGGKQVYVIFKNWKLWWTANQSYLLKKINATWDSSVDGLNWNWNDIVFHRSYWAENPAEMKLQNFGHNSADKKIGKSATDAKADNYKDYSEYCLENAADPDGNGFKLNYNPDAALTNRTLVYMSAVLVTLEGDGDIKNATPLTLVEWSARKYTQENAMTEMFAPVENIVYFRHTESGGTAEDGTPINDTYTYIPVQVSDLEFVTGLDAGLADNASENSKRYMSYLNLKSTDLFGEKTYNGATYTVDNGKLFYKDENSAWAEYASVDDANSVFESVGGAKVWNDGNTYYYHEITHLGTTGKDGNGVNYRYGVVRNHIYDVEINSVFGLGTPVLNPNGSEDGGEDIIPQKPSPDANLLGVEVKILSWRVVNNNVTLEW